MGKRVLIGFIALASLLGFQGGTAEAGCLRWATVGGSSICCAWSPKGLEANVKFNQQCATFGEGTSFGACNANAEAVASDSVAFCVDPTAPGGIRKVDCPGQRVFEQVIQTDCDPKHDKDVNPGPGVGTGHGHHGGCTQRLILVAECQDCCDAFSLGACLDVTPVEMDTRVVAQVFSFGGELSATGGVVTQQTGNAECPPESNTCVFTEHCSINPKKLQFIGLSTESEGLPDTSNQKYQCEYTCVSGNFFGCPLFGD